MWRYLNCNSIRGFQSDRINARAARSPGSRVGGLEECLNGRSYGRCEVGNSGVVADENTRPAQPAGEFIKVVDSDCPFEFLFGPAQPIHGHLSRKPECDLLE